MLKMRVEQGPFPHLLGGSCILHGCNKINKASGIKPCHTSLPTPGRNPTDHMPRSFMNGYSSHGLAHIQSKSQNFDSLSPRRNSERKGLKIAWLLSRLFQELLDHLLLCCKFPNKGSTVSATFHLIISGKAVISEAPHTVVPKSSGGDYDGVGGF